MYLDIAWLPHPSWASDWINREIHFLYIHESVYLELVCIWKDSTWKCHIITSIVQVYAVYCFSWCVGRRHVPMLRGHSQSFGSIFPLMLPSILLSAFNAYRAERSLTSLCIRKKECKKRNSWFRSRRYRIARMWSAHLLRNSRSLIRFNSWRIRDRFFSRGHSFFADMMRSCQSSWDTGQLNPLRFENATRSYLWQIKPSRTISIDLSKKERIVLSRNYGSPSADLFWILFHIRVKISRWVVIWPAADQVIWMVSALDACNSSFAWTISVGDAVFFEREKRGGTYQCEDADDCQTFCVTRHRCTRRGQK